MTQLVFVEGTWGGTWARARSPFSKMLREHNFAPMRFQGWSKNVSGVPNILSRQKHSDWIAGGYALGYFLLGLDYMDRNIICHSHGLNPVLYCCVRMGVPIRRVVSICSPVRKDMRVQATGAIHKYIEQWRHVSSHDGDWMQRFGEFFDGEWAPFGVRKWEIPHAPNLTNLCIPNIGHSKIFEPEFLNLWSDDGLLDFLRGEVLGV